MSELNEMQNCLTGILKDFHNFCHDHSLRYYAIGGTALGAIRHQGFIPWDDDIDVGMPRPDYEKLIKTYNQKNKRFFLESPYSKNDDYLYPYVKIYDTSTSLTENFRIPVKRGVFLDVFPIDGAGNNEKDFLSINWKIKLLLKLNNINKADTRKCNNFLRRIYYRFVQIATCKMNMKKVCKKIDKISQKYDYDTSDYVTCYTGGYGKEYISNKEVFGEPRAMKFDSFLINCPQKTEEFLTHFFGKWKELPPEEKRVSIHDYELDLKTGYKS